MFLETTGRFQTIRICLNSSFRSRGGPTWSPTTCKSSSCRHIDVVTALRRPFSVFWTIFFHSLLLKRLHDKIFVQGTVIEWFTSYLSCRFQQVLVGQCYSSENPLLWPRGGELRTQILKSHLLRTQSLKVLPLKPGIVQYIAMHATLTAGDFFLANFCPSGPFTCIFPKPIPNFSSVSCGLPRFLCRPAD